MKVEAIESALTSVTKTYTTMRKREERESQRLSRRSYMLRPKKRISLISVAFEIMEWGYNHVSSNGERPAGIRQIMYACRPDMLERSGEETFTDNYFTQKIWHKYCEAHDTSSWDVVFDARGHLIEPHTRKQVELGTIDVRNYLRGEGYDEEPDFRMSMNFPTKGPNHRFSAVLFIEKEGFHPLFKQVKLAEKWDLAIMSTKGQSVIAARDLICGLGVPVYVLHDFDKPGFSIVGAMIRGTDRYPHPLDNVVDIGLRLEDVEEHNLVSEPFVPKGDPWVVRDNMELNGATEDEIEFLMTRRVELNAFTSNDFIEWIESKLTEHGVKKVVPDDDRLEEAFRRAAKVSFFNGHIDDIEDAADEHAENITIPDDLDEQVRKGLEEDSHLAWDDVIAELVGQEE